MTPYQCYLSRWRKGCGSEYCSRAANVCHVRGVLPAHVVFIGEGPGDSENVLGQPFKGPAGHLLDQIVRDSGAGAYRCAFMNIVGCLPSDEDGNKVGEPDEATCKTCLPRLIDLVRLAKPRVIVLLGKVASRWVSGQRTFDPVDWMPPGELIRFAEILHPAAILKGTSVANRGFTIQRQVIRLAEALEAGPVARRPLPIEDEIPF